MPDKFDGTGFKTWFEKMLFFLTVMCMERFLKETRPVVLDPTNDTYGMSVQQAWDRGDYLCQGYIRGRLVDSLYNVYSKVG